MAMTLYWGSGSPPSWRAMLVLSDKGLSYESKMLTFSKKEHKTDEMLALNPRGQCPTFTHGDVIVNESLAIMDYLEFLHPEKGSVQMPSDPIKRALIIQRKQESQNVYTNIITPLLFSLYRTKPEDRKMDEVTPKIEAARTELALWDGYLSKAGSGSYIAGKEVSVADFAFFPYFALLVRVGLNMDKYPHLAAYHKQMCEVPAVKDTWPPHWKEGGTDPILADVI